MPFGAVLHPTIDSMFGHPPVLAVAQQELPVMTPPSLLQSTSDCMMGAPDLDYSSPTPSASMQTAVTTMPSPLAGAIHTSTNPAFFCALLSLHRCRGDVYVCTVPAM